MVDGLQITVEVQKPFKLAKFGILKLLVGMHRYSPSMSWKDLTFSYKGLRNEFGI